MTPRDRTAQQQALRALDRIQERVRMIPARSVEALNAVGQQWAAQAQAEAPQNTGALRTSITWEPAGGDIPGGALVMRYYGEIVAKGIPGASVASALGRTVSMPPLLQRARAVAARQRYAARVGRAIEHPNDFIERAWDSDQVQGALRRFPEVALRRD